MTKTTTLVAALMLTLTGGVGRAAPTHERTIQFEEPVQAGARLRIENLIGSIRVRGVDVSEGLRIEGQVLAEAPTAALARELAASVTLEAMDDDGERVVRAKLPVDRHRLFRVPAVGFGGMLGKWVTPLVRKSTLALEYDGQSVQVGQQRGAAAVSVDLIVDLPFDVASTFRQALGSIDVNAVRGDVTVEVLNGLIEVEQLFGSLSVQGGDGDVIVRRFHGENLDLHAGAGNVELQDVRAATVGLTSAAGEIQALKLEGESTTVRTGSGDVALADFESEAFEIETQTGSVAIASRLSSLNEARIASATGNVVLRVASDRGFDVSANTKSGDITAYRMDLDILTEQGQTVARRGRGGPRIDVAVPDGKLTVRPDDGNWAARLNRR